MVKAKSNPRTQNEGPLEAYRRSHRNRTKIPKPLSAEEFDAVKRKDLDAIMLRYYLGNKLELFHAIIRCGKYGIAPPEWITYEVEKAFRRYTSAEVRTLDKAFDINRHGVHLPAEQDRVKKAWRVYQEIERRHGGGEGLGPELYELVGRGFNISGSTARRYYEDVRRTLQAPK
jgi:hypothetical protein